MLFFSSILGYRHWFNLLWAILCHLNLACTERSLSPPHYPWSCIPSLWPTHFHFTPAAHSTTSVTWFISIYSFSCLSMDLRVFFNLLVSVLVKVHIWTPYIRISRILLLLLRSQEAGYLFLLLFKPSILLHLVLDNFPLIFFFVFS